MSQKSDPCGKNEQTFYFYLYHSIMTSICNIPHEIFINHIATNINLSQVETLTSVSKEWYRQKEEIVNNIIHSDEFLRTCIAPDELISMIKKSHFTLKSFQCVLNGLCGTHEFSFSLAKRSTTTESINNSFRIFQLLKKYAIAIDCRTQILNKISDLLVDYFDELFKQRSSYKKYNSSIIGSYFRKEDCDWHTIDINPYYIYENMNYILSSCRSFLYRQNIENRIKILMIDSYENQGKTLKFLMSLMNYGDMGRRIYIFYEIVKYLNDIYPSKYLGDKIARMCRMKIEEFRPDIAKSTKNVPVFLKKAVMAEFDKFLELNKV